MLDLLHMNSQQLVISCAICWFDIKTDTGHCHAGDKQEKKKRRRNYTWTGLISGEVIWLGEVCKVSNMSWMSSSLRHKDADLTALEAGD